MAKALQIQRGAVGKGLGRAYGVDARQKAANPLQHFPVVQLRPAPAAPGADAEQKACVLMHGAALQHQRRNDGDFLGGQLLREGVFLLNLRTAPAAGAVELGHDLVAIVLMGQIDAVLIGAERRQAPVRQQTRGAQRINHAVRREIGIGVRGVLQFAHAAIVMRKSMRGRQLTRL